MPKPKTNPILLSSRIEASSFVDEAMTCSVIAYAGAPVSTWEGDYTLSLDAGAVDFSRTSNGAGVFLDHNHSIDAQVGTIIGAELIEGKGVRMDIRFGAHPEAARYYQGAKDGIYRNLSIGAMVQKKKDITAENSSRKQFLATKWQPFEVSLVGVPADPRARFLSQEESPEPEDETEVQGSAPDKSKEVHMDTPEVNTGQTAAPNPEVIAAAVKAEGARVSAIHAIGAKAGLPAEAIQSAAGNPSITIEAFKGVVADHLMAEHAKQPDTRHGAAAATVVGDESDKRRHIMGQALLAQIDGAKYKADDANDYRGMRISRLAEECVKASGRSVRGLSVNDIAVMAMHSTSDFPYILENTARKVMLDQYSYATPTYRTWAKGGTAVDFKAMSRLRLSETPTFNEVPEGDEITMGTMSESKESYAILTYGRGLSFTRQMIVNDDLGAFNGLAAEFGMQAARKENKLVYAILQANAAMGDGTALFHANHGNLGVGAIGNTGLDAMFLAMATQKGLDGETVLNIEPKYLIVPIAKQTTAKTAMTAVGPNVKTSDQNWFAGRLEVIADAELDTNGSGNTVWYAAADPGMVPTIEYAHLSGANGPQMIRKENDGGILGVQLYCYFDFGAKAIDWKGLYKSSGS